jgi:hypothetical protein
VLETTRYYEDFCRYFLLAKTQQEECNLGFTPHQNSSVADSLMKQVHLYDVVERKYAGFSQIVNDIFYGLSESHPYWKHMKEGLSTKQRMDVATAWNEKYLKLNFPAWLYVLLVHRLTGSGINYSKKPSGYNNTVLPALAQGNKIDDFVEIIRDYKPSKYTSVGYQFPAFPKPKMGYAKGGDYFLCEMLPELAEKLAGFLEYTQPLKKSLRQVGDFMFQWNKEKGLRAYRFQYAAFIADIADWFPQFVYRESPFYYGSNARECLKYLAKRPAGMNEDEFLDAITFRIMEDTGAVPYDSEDVCCDFIRWIENYVRPGGDYDHVDRDKVWSSSSIKDHPYGRQEAMLRFGLVKSFNDMDVHPSDAYVLETVGMSVESYKQLVNKQGCLEHDHNS